MGGQDKRGTVEAWSKYKGGDPKEGIEGNVGTKIEDGDLV